MDHMWKFYLSYSYKSKKEKKLWPWIRDTQVMRAFYYDESHRNTFLAQTQKNARL